MLNVLLLAGWVLVANPHGIKNADSFLPLGEACLVTSFLHLTDSGTLDPQWHLYRLMYTQVMPYNAICPAGTLFLAAPSMVEQWQAEERAQRDALTRHRETIQRLLKAQPGALTN